MPAFHRNAGNMSEPTHLFIKRDPAKVQVGTVVQQAGEWDNREDKTKLTIHKVTSFYSVTYILSYS